MPTKSCLRHTQKKYRSRPSPPYPAQDCKGKIKFGNDGKTYQSVADSRGVYRWAARKTLKAPKGTVYKTHDNGGRPFAVFVQNSKKMVIVYRQKYNDAAEDYIMDDSKIIYQTSFKNIWIGKDPIGITYKWEPWMLGNTVLLQIAASRYVFIGHNIYEFSMGEEDSVKNYVSPVGNSDAPYPYIIGKKNTYFLLDGDGKCPCYIPNEFLDLTIDAYAQYYGHRLAAKGTGSVEVPEKYRDVAKHAVSFRTKMISPRILV